MENKKTQHRYANKEENALLDRLEKYRGNHLLFQAHLISPFPKIRPGIFTKAESYPHSLFLPFSAIVDPWRDME